MDNHKFCLQPFQPTTIDPKITSEITRDNHIINFRYEIKSDLNKLEVPDIADSEARKDELWKTTCFELFIGIENSSRYWEFNLSPSGDWNVYRFDNYRQGMQEEILVESLNISIYRGCRDLLVGVDKFDLRNLTSSLCNFNVSIATVVKEKNGNISYWALKHCGEEADFHLRDSFVFDM
ncbi:MAG: DOMON-like domain-containing protein [Rivularia sp. (in: cyanobacteria)]